LREVEAGENRRVGCIAAAVACDNYPDDARIVVSGIKVEPAPRHYLWHPVAGAPLRAILMPKQLGRFPLWTLASIRPLFLG
jgi:hypothetical protein